MDSQLSYSQELTGFLAETDPFMEQLDTLPLETAAELYDMFEEAARSATENILQIDTELRVEICIRQDKLIERIADVFPPFEHTGDPIGVYTPAIQDFRRWSNTELMKDKGLVGYMLAKELGGRCVMYYGTAPADYPYLSALHGMEVSYPDTGFGSDYAYYQYLRDHYQEMDVLVLHGMYIQTVEYLDMYRKLRPDGKVYCGLDMNSWWMNNTTWDNPLVKRFSKQCDVVATSCSSLRDALNRNPSVHFPCHWFPNGYYNPTGVKAIADPALKENTIITVGRIGAAQKNNAELMVAFARASDALSQWKLKLIGGIEKEFHSQIDEYFTRRPDLKDRVIFTGPITDKDVLYNEYAKAKVFALSSQSEGMPNVFAEALFHGCMFVTSDIDAANDITNAETLGMTYSRGDIDALSNALIKVCKKANRTGVERHIPKALEHAAKYYDWNRNIKKLAYMLYK